MTLQKLSPLLWIFAFLCSLFIINAWQLELFATAIILLFIWSVITLSQNVKTGWVMPKSWALRFMGGFWLLSFFSVITSDILNISFMAFCLTSALPLGFFIFTLQGQTENSPENFQRQMVLIAKALGTIFALLSLWAVAQIFFFSEIFGVRAHHPLANPNSFGALFCLAFFPAIGWMIYTQKKQQKTLALILSTLIFCGLLATASRGAFLSMLCVMPVFLFLFKDQVKPNKQFLLFLLMGCLICFSVTFLGNDENTKEHMATRMIETIAMTDNDISSNRISIWSGAWDTAKQNWLWGTGIGTFYMYYPEFKLKTDPYTVFYAHNDPLQYLAELGILGPILFYLFILAVLGRTFQAIKKADKQGINYALTVTTFCAMGCIILHTHITFNLYNLSILFGLSFLLSVWFWATQKILSASEEAKYITFPENFSSASRITTLALPFIFLGLLFSSYILSERYTNLARNHIMKAELEEFIADFFRANKFGFDGNYRSYLLAVNLPMTILENTHKKLSEEERREVFDQALNYLNHILKINPRSAAANYYMAYIQSIVPASFLSESMLTPEEYYKKSLQLDPVHLGARVRLAQLHAANNEHEEELRILEEGFDYRYASDRAIAYYQYIAAVYLKKGDVDNSQRALRRLQHFKEKIEEQKKLRSSQFHQLFWRTY